MACLNTNGFLVPTGVGLFGSQSGKETPEKLSVYTFINIAGWIPGISLVAGVASIFFGIILQDEDQNRKLVGAALIIRGILQIAQVGIILAPFDIGFSLVRLVREHMKNKAARLPIT